ncbi:glycosyltransferase [Patescibacteria group bacterium]|nr:glycosyltransferase [Patescibacteria group bacterium]
MKTKQINIFALAAFGEGLSGGDRIFIEFARRWSKRCSVDIFVWTEGYEMCERQSLKGSRIKDQGSSQILGKTNIKGIKYFVSRIRPWCNLGFFICYLARVIEGIRLGLTTKLVNEPETVVYSASEFWMDSLPAYLLKLRFPKVTWMASWYQTAPNPLMGYKEGDRKASYRLPAFYFWFMQQPIKPLVKKKADFILINNEREREYFPEFDKKGKIIIVFGAIPLRRVKEWKSKRVKVEKKYVAVFQGRFHPQKGVLELIDIWKKVVERIPNAQLAMIGDGPLMGSVKLKIESLKLKNNIKLFGYVFDGPKKYKIFSQSKIVVHPAFFDSGGMASAEAMAFGLPCVGFNLRSYESYYPKGMLKVEINDIDAFADEIVKLLKNSSLRKKIGGQALRMIESNWSWERRAKETLDYVENYKKE